MTFHVLDLGILDRWIDILFWKVRPLVLHCFVNQQSGCNKVTVTNHNVCLTTKYLVVGNGSFVGMDGENRQDMGWRQ